MKKKLLNLLLVLLLLVSIPGSLLLASDISGALYKMSIVVSNNGTLANYVSTNGVISTPNLIAGGFLNSSANNCAVLDKASNDIPFMPGYSTNPWVFWVETIGSDAYINYDLYTADTTGGTIAYFPDTTGMIVSDNSTIELGSDFEVEVEGRVDTTLSANASLVFKDDAFRTYIDGATNITSEVDNNYPIVEAVNGGNDVVNQLNHTVNLPAGIANGDLLLVFFVSDGNPVIGFPAGWTQLFEDHDGAGNVTFTCEYRIADGTEGANITVTTSNIQMTAHTSYRISDYLGVPEVGVSVGGATNIPDPPNLVPSWGSAKTLWFACTGYNNGTETVNTYPTSYTDGRNDRANNAANGCGVGTARRELTAASENPGIFTLGGAEFWVSNTIAVRPDTIREVTATGITSGEHTVKTYGVANEPAWATGDVLHFDGSATSNVDVGAIHNASAKLWVSFWFKLDSAFSSATGTNQYIFGKRITDNDRIYAYLDASNGKLRFRKVTGGVQSFSILTVEASWNADTWYHIILSISDVAAVRMIVDNGVAVTDADVSAAPNGGDFVIGNYYDGYGVGFVGEIQNVIVGTDDLTADEEAALYAGTAPGDETNYWYIDEGTGLTTYDYGTGDNDGAIDNAPTWQTSTYTTGKTGRLCDFYIEVDDGVADPDRWGANLKGASVPDNANDWEFFLNGAMPYVYSDKITVGGVLHAWHEWEYDTTFHDRSYYGLDFDGAAAADDDVKILDDASITDIFDGGGTIIAWIYVASDGEANLGFIGRKGSGWQFMSTFEVAGEVSPYFIRNFDGNNGEWYTTDTEIMLNTWTMVALTYDDGDTANNPTLYVNDTVFTVGDGLTEGVIPAGNAVSDAGSDMFIGNNTSAGIRCLDGLMDELSAYTRILDQAEITYNFNAGVGNYTPYSTTGLVGHWHAEEGSGTNLADSSGEGNTGTLENGVAWVNGQVPRPAGSPGTNDATPSFRTASSDADVVATAVSFQPIEEAKAPPWTLTEETATWLTAANVVGNFTTTPSPSYPGANVIEDIAAASGTPAQLPFVIIFGFITLAVSLSISSVLRQHGSRSLAVKIIVIGGLLGIGEVLGIIDFWMLVFYLIIALAVMAASRSGSII